MSSGTLVSSKRRDTRPCGRTRVSGCRVEPEVRNAPPRHASASNPVSPSIPAAGDVKSSGGVWRGMCWTGNTRRWGCQSPVNRRWELRSGSPSGISPALSGAVRDERWESGWGCYFWGRSDTHLAGTGKWGFDEAPLVTDFHGGESVAE